MEQKIIDYIEKNRSNIIEDTKKLVSFASIYSKPEEIEKALDFVLSRAREMGFKTETTSGKDVGIIEIGDGDETVGILVHVDVVDVGDIEKWDTPPFECVEKNGYLWGRGTMDDKGPVIMSLYTLKALVDMGIPLKKKIQLIVGTSEEMEWTDIEHFKEQFPTPDFGFSPDGDFPIYNAEKGYCDIEMTFTEPGLDEILKLDSGSSPNSIPSKAVVRFKGQDEQLYEGVSVHSSEPEAGINAIEKLCLALADKTEFNFIRFVNDYLEGDIFASALGIDQVVNEIKGIPSEPTTAVPTILKLIDVGVFLNINIRQKVGVTEKDIVTAFEKIPESYSFKFRVKGCEDGMIVDEGLPSLQRMRQTALDNNIDGSFKLAKGSSYAKTMDKFVSWGPNFPEEENTCHMENEHISITNMLLATELYISYLICEMQS